MASRFYNHQNEPVECGLKEAREKNYRVSVTTVLSETMPKYGLRAYRDKQIALAAAQIEIGVDIDGSYRDETREDWLIRVFEKADEHREAAAEFGGELHKAIEQSLTNTGNALDRVRNWKYKGWVDPFMQWVDDNVSEVLWTEKVLSSSLGYAGRADAKVILKDNRIAILDFKTQDLKGKSPNWYKEWPIQLEAYSHADEESGEIVDCYFSIVFDSKNPGAPRIREWPADERLDRWLDFWSCLSHWQRMNKFYPKDVDTLATR